MGIEPVKKKGVDCVFSEGYGLRTGLGQAWLRSREGRDF